MGWSNYFAQNKAGGERYRAISVFKEDTGELLLKPTEMKGGPVFRLIEDKLLHTVDASHSDRLTMALYTADPQNFRRLCDAWKPPHTSTTGYEVIMETPYVDGCIFMRTRDGRVRCYDLRKK